MTAVLSVRRSLGVETHLQVRLHLAAELVALEIERARGEDPARADAGRRQREELLHGRLELGLEVGGAHRPVHQSVALVFPRDEVGESTLRISGVRPCTSVLAPSSPQP